MTRQVGKFKFWLQVGTRQQSSGLLLAVEGLSLPLRLILLPAPHSHCSILLGVPRASRPDCSLSPLHSLTVFTPQSFHATARFMVLKTCSGSQLPSDQRPESLLWDSRASLLLSPTTRSTHLLHPHFHILVYSSSCR